MSTSPARESRNSGVAGATGTAVQLSPESTARRDTLRAQDGIYKQQLARLLAEFDHGRREHNSKMQRVDEDIKGVLGRSERLQGELVELQNGITQSNSAFLDLVRDGGGRDEMARLRREEASLQSKCAELNGNLASLKGRLSALFDEKEIDEGKWGEVVEEYKAGSDRMRGVIAGGDKELKAMEENIPLGAARGDNIEQHGGNAEDVNVPRAGDGQTNADSGMVSPETLSNEKSLDADVSARNAAAGDEEGEDKEGTAGSAAQPMATDKREEQAVGVLAGMRRWRSQFVDAQEQTEARTVLHSAAGGVEAGKASPAVAGMRPCPAPPAFAGMWPGPAPPPHVQGRPGTDRPSSPQQQPPTAERAFSQPPQRPTRPEPRRQLSHRPSALEKAVRDPRSFQNAARAEVATVVPGEASNDRAATGGGRRAHIAARGSHSNRAAIPAVPPTGGPTATEVGRCPAPQLSAPTGPPAQPPAAEPSPPTSTASPPATHQRPPLPAPKRTNLPRPPPLADKAESARSGAGSARGASGAGKGGSRGSAPAATAARGTAAASPPREGTDPKLLAIMDGTVDLSQERKNGAGAFEDGRKEGGADGELPCGSQPDAGEESSDKSAVVAVTDLLGHDIEKENFVPLDRATPELVREIIAANRDIAPYGASKCGGGVVEMIADDEWGVLSSVAPLCRMLRHGVDETNSIIGGVEGCVHMKLEDLFCSATLEEDIRQKVDLAGDKHARVFLLEYDKAKSMPEWE